MKKQLTLFLLLTISISFGQEQTIYTQDKETVLVFFKAETIGGKLDFENNMKDDKTPFYLVDRVAYNRKDFGILLWAQAIKKTNHFSIKEAILFWQEIKKRKLTKPEKKAFSKGFKMVLE